MGHLQKKGIEPLFGVAFTTKRANDGATKGYWG
jgi:hypothetical protein